MQPSAWILLFLFNLVPCWHHVTMPGHLEDETHVKKCWDNPTENQFLEIGAVLNKQDEVYHRIRKPPETRRISRLLGKIFKQQNCKLKECLSKFLNVIVGCYTAVANWYMKLRAMGLSCLLIFIKLISLYKNTLSLSNCYEAKMCTGALP